jgi:predicted AAA+ superfamily ATPase
MIKRQIEEVILKRWGKGKAIILLGPRQTGKTTLLEKIASEKGKFLLLDCDEFIVRLNYETETNLIHRDVAKKNIEQLDWKPTTHPR